MVRLKPWWPISSWSDARTSGRSELGRTSCLRVPRRWSACLRWSTPFRNSRGYCCTSAGMERSLLSEGLGGQAASTGPRTGSRCCSCCKSAITVWGPLQLQPREQPFHQVPPPCPGSAQEPWCRQGHQQWGWGRQPAAGTGDHWQWLPLVAPQSGGVQKRIRGACGKGYQQGWSFQVCTGCQNRTVWAEAHLCSNAPNFAERK